MTDDENLAFITAVMAASKEAAGLPPEWGTTPAPLSAEAELEDAPRPPRLRDGMTTAELLPYGDVVLGPDGQERVLERLTCPPFHTPGWRHHDLRPGVAGVAGAIPRDRPAWLGAAGRGRGAALVHGARRGAPAGGRRRRRRRGRDVLGRAPANRVHASPSTRGAAPSSPATGWPPSPRAPRTSCPRSSTRPWWRVEVDGLPAGALFGSGDGPGGYELMLGRGRWALPVALLVDLRVLPRDGRAR